MNSTLTADQVRQILAELSNPNPRSFREIAAEHGVRHTAISNIYRGYTWKHIERPPILCYRGSAKGERCHLSRLTADSVKAIRALKGTGRSQWSVACEYGVTQGTVSDIWLGKQWKHLGSEP